MELFCRYVRTKGHLRRIVEYKYMDQVAGRSDFTARKSEPG